MFQRLNLCPGYKFKYSIGSLNGMHIGQIIYNKYQELVYRLSIALSILKQPSIILINLLSVRI